MFEAPLKDPSGSLDGDQPTFDGTCQFLWNLYSLLGVDLLHGDLPI
jgi:hypothetical protein